MANDYFARMEERDDVLSEQMQTQVNEWVNDLKTEMQSNCDVFCVKVFSEIIKKIMSLSSSQEKEYMSFCVQNILDQQIGTQKRGIIINAVRLRYTKFLEDKIKEMETVARFYISLLQEREGVKNKGNLDEEKSIVKESFNSFLKEKNIDSNDVFVEKLVLYIENNVDSILDKLSIDKTSEDLSYILKDEDVIEDKLKIIFKEKDTYQKAIALFKMFFDDNKELTEYGKAITAIKKIYEIYPWDQNLVDEEELMDLLIRNMKFSNGNIEKI